MINSNIVPSNSRSGVKFCYCDESGVGDEPIAVMVGVVVDASRMHLTKDDWQELLGSVSKFVGKPIPELHTKAFYAGNSPFRDLTGTQRSNIISIIYDWLAERKHHVVYTSVFKEKYENSFAKGDIPDELNTVWRFLGFHLVLAMQRHCQKQAKQKGHTIYVFDNKEREEKRFVDIILRPPKWSDEYYGRKLRQKQLDQIIDVPYFGDSKDVGLIQLADFFSFFLRRYAEISEGLAKPNYKDERSKLSNWIKIFAERSIGRAHIYPKGSLNSAEELFFNHAPPSIRILGS